MAFANDTFTESGSGTVALTSHTSDSGHVWKAMSDNGATSWVVNKDNDDSYMVSPANTNGGYYLDVTPPSPDYEVRAAVNRKSQLGAIYMTLRARWSTSAASGYSVWLGGNNGSNGKYQLYLQRYTAGSYSALISPSPVDASPSYPTSVEIGIRVIGSTIQGLYNGAVFGTATDTTYASAGVCGMNTYLENPGANVGASTGWHWDDFSATDLIRPIQPRITGQAVQRAATR